MAVGKDTLWTDTVVADSAKSLTDSHVEHEPAITAGSHVISDEVVGSFECPFTRDFDTLVQNTLDQWHIQGMSIAVVHGDKTWTKGYGHSILPDEPVQPTTLFYTGSTTKSFLAAAVSTLVHDNDKFGEIQWDTPLNQLIRDDFVLQDHYATSHVTIEDALSHRTGMPGHTLTFGGSTLKESVRSLRHLYMNKPIRTTWQYCNLMYMAVSHMVEVVTGSWLGDFMKKRIWEPLGMKQTFFKLADAEEYVRQHHPECQIAVGYSWDKTNEVAKAVPCWRDMVVSGAGAIISSAEDYAKYLRMMIEQPQDGPLPNQSYTDVTSPRTIMPPFDPHYSQTLLYALGWIIGVYNGETVVSHGGGLEGFSTGMLYLPARKFGVAILANTQSRGTEVPAWHLIDNLLNVPLEKRVDMFEWNENAEAENKKQIASAPARLYPSVPSPGLSLTLPLSAYTGTYTNDAYRPFVISLTDEPDAKLRAVTEGPVQVVLSLVHVTGEHFVANMFLFTHATEPLAALKAQFKIGIQGKVSEFGAELDFLSGGGAMIWFKRIEE